MRKRRVSKACGERLKSAFKHKTCALHIFMEQFFWSVHSAVIEKGKNVQGSRASCNVCNLNVSWLTWRIKCYSFYKWLLALVNRYAPLWKKPAKLDPTKVKQLTTRREKCDLFEIRSIGRLRIESLNHRPFPEHSFPFNLDIGQFISSHFGRQRELPEEFDADCLPGLVSKSKLTAWVEYCVTSNWL